MRVTKIGKVTSDQLDVYLLKAEAHQRRKIVFGGHVFPYPYYLKRRSDIDQKRPRRLCVSALNLIVELPLWPFMTSRRQSHHFHKWNQNFQLCVNCLCQLDSSCSTNCLIYTFLCMLWGYSHVLDHMLYISH